MATTTIYADTSDGHVVSIDADYSTARAGSGLSADDTSGTFAVGQRDASGDVIIYEGFLQFDTSGIPDGDTVDSVVLSVFGTIDDTVDADPTIEARDKDWGASLDTGDWVAGADLGGPTLLATFDTSGGWSTSGYNDFTSESAFTSAIDKTGQTRPLLNSDRHRTGTFAAGNTEYVRSSSADESGTTEDPKLVVTHSSSAPTIAVWTGAAWETKPVKYWDGAAWTAPSAVRYWDGAAWVEV